MREIIKTRHPGPLEHGLATKKELPDHKKQQIFYHPTWDGAHLTNHGQGQVRPKNHAPHF